MCVDNATMSGPPIMSAVPCTIIMEFIIDKYELFKSSVECPFNVHYVTVLVITPPGGIWLIYKHNP